METLAEVVKMQTSGEVKVWDALVRVFHWSLVAAFTVAYFTEEELLGLHVWAGYAVLGLIGFRLLWGLVGPAHARFSDFVRSPGAVLGYLRSLAGGKAPRYLGHNPAGGAMIVALLVMVTVTCVSGLVVYAVDPGAGPLVGLVHGREETWEEVHEVAANLTVLLVFVHVAGVVFASLREHENLVRSMLTGRKRA